MNNRAIVPDGFLQRRVFAPRDNPDRADDAAMFSAWQKSPGPETIAPIMAAAEPEIRKSLAAYGMADDPVMVSKARALAVKSFSRFDPAKSSLRTFVGQQMQGLRRLSLEMQPIRIPEKAYYDHRAIRSAEEELQSELGRAPTVQEISDRSRLSIRRISKLRSGFRPVRAEESARSTDDSGKEESIGYESASPDELFQESFYAGITDPVDRLIFESFTGFGGKPAASMTEVAKRAGVSNAAISQRAARLTKDYQEVMAKLGRVMT